MDDRRRSHASSVVGDAGGGLRNSIHGGNMSGPSHRGPRTKPNRPWSPEEIDALRCLIEAGATRAKIGETLGRSKNSVLGKARDLDMLNRPQPRDELMPEEIAARNAAIKATIDKIKRDIASKPLPDIEAPWNPGLNGAIWNEEELDTLRREWRNGASVADIAALLPGRSPRSIRDKREQIGLPPRAPKHGAAIVAKVHELAFAGASRTEIASLTGMTGGQIHGMIRYREANPNAIHPDRVAAGPEPLPPGHPISWGAIDVAR